MRGSQPTGQPVVSSTATAPNAGSGPSLRRLSAARAFRPLLGGALEVLQPCAERAIERPLQALDLSLHRFALPRLRGSDDYAVALGFERPDVDGDYALCRAAPDDPAGSIYLFDGRGDVQASGLPAKDRANLERSLGLHTVDVRLPGGPIVDIRLNFPDRLDRCADHDLVPGDDGRILVDIHAFSSVALRAHVYRFPCTAAVP